MPIKFNILDKLCNVTNCRVVNDKKLLTCKSIWANLNSVPTKIWEYIPRITDKFLLVSSKGDTYTSTDLNSYNKLDGKLHCSGGKIIKFHNDYYSFSGDNTPDNNRVYKISLTKNSVSSEQIFSGMFDYISNIDCFNDIMFVSGRYLPDMAFGTFYSNDLINWMPITGWSYDSSGNIESRINITISKIIEIDDYLIGYNGMVYRINKNDLFLKDWTEVKTTPLKLWNTYFTLDRISIGKFNNKIILTLASSGKSDGTGLNYYSDDYGETWILFNDTVGFSEIYCGKDFILSISIDNVLYKISSTFEQTRIGGSVNNISLQYRYFLDCIDDTFFLTWGEDVDINIYCSNDGENWVNFISPNYKMYIKKIN